MPSPFARTLRSIESDKFNLSLISTAVAITIIVAWSIWFFFSQITIYVDSTVIDIKGDGYIETRLSATDMKNVRQGQNAIIIFDGELGDELGVVSAMVNQIERGATEALVQLYAPYQFAELNAINTEPSGVIRIQIETTSPANLIMRALGRTSDTPALVSGPQQ